MTSKKAVLILLASLIALAVFTGCSGDEDPVWDDVSLNLERELVSVKVKEIAEAESAHLEKRGKFTDNMVDLGLPPRGR